MCLVLELLMVKNAVIYGGEIFPCHSEYFLHSEKSGTTFFEITSLSRIF